MISGASQQSSEQPVSSGRRKLFGLILILIVCLPMLLTELGLRTIGKPLPYDPYIHFGQIDSFFSRQSADGTDYYQVASREVYRERQVKFAGVKPPNTFRIFCLGGSASAGWPHPENEIYSAYLQQALAHAYPDRRIEVINVSAHAYAAYRVRFILQEVINFDPDLIVIYSGNNEFIERRTYKTVADWTDPVLDLAKHSAIFRRFRGSSFARRFFPDNTLSADEREHVRYEQWSKIERLALKLRHDPAQFAFVKAHYAYSLTSMAQIAKEKGVPVILVTVPVNLRDWHPNVSDQPLDGDRMARWLDAYREGRAHLLRHDFSTAVRSLEAAAALSPTHAETQFYLGHAHEELSHFSEALRRYDLARDLDRNPFRAISEFNSIVKEVAAHEQATYLADAEVAFHAASKPFAPGFDLFLDYVHPTTKGNRLVAATVFNTILEHRLIPGNPTSQRFETQGTENAQQDHAYEEHRDQALQGMMVRLFVMMHQYQGALDKSRLLVEMKHPIGEIREKDIGLAQDVLRLFPQLLSLESDEIAGHRVDAARRAQIQSDLHAFYAQHFPGYNEFRIQRELDEKQAYSAPQRFTRASP